MLYADDIIMWELNEAPYISKGWLQCVKFLNYMSV
jgi:hypothetical protein